MILSLRKASSLIMTSKYLKKWEWSKLENRTQHSPAHCMLWNHNGNIYRVFQMKYETMSDKTSSLHSIWMNIKLNETELKLNYDLPTDPRWVQCQTADGEWENIILHEDFFTPYYTCQYFIEKLAIKMRVEKFLLIRKVLHHTCVGLYTINIDSRKHQNVEYQIDQFCRIYFIDLKSVFDIVFQCWRH